MRRRSAEAPPSLPLDADHLTKRMHDFDKIALRRHDRIDILVGGRTLVQDAAVQTGFDAFHRFSMLLERNPALRLGAREPAPRAVRAGMERLRVAQSAHDIAARSHAARNDPHLARSGAYSALPGKPHCLAEMLLALHVVVVTVHRQLVAGKIRPTLAKNIEHH